MIKRLIASASTLNRSHYSILTFHSIGSRYSFSVDPNKFYSLIDSLCRSGKIVPLGYCGALASKLSTDKSCNRYFSITIDDGYEDNLIIAKYLIEKKLPFTLFLNGGLFDGHRKLCIDDISRSRGLQFCDTDFLTLNDAISLSESKYVTISPHGYRHIPLNSMPVSQLESELKKTKEIFRFHNFDVINFGIPYGRVGIDFGLNEVVILKKHGFIPFSLSPTAITGNIDAVFPRIGLGVEDHDIWIQKANGAGRLWKLLRERKLR